ncbi:MAG: SpoIIE family protein phosphatase [Spirochaetales bacterium]|nr:SpoIIE family protein phosphatase [Spirochaetales bacterium]
MKLDEFLESRTPLLPGNFNLTHEELVKFFWKYKGLQLDFERNNTFWKATNENLTLAYKKLDEQEKELEHVYRLIQEDLNVAHGIQKALFPTFSREKNMPFELAFYNKQLDQVGGDYFDFFTTRQGYNAIGVFDISGHGVSAALIMAYLKSQFMLIMENLDSPREIIEHINNISLPFFKRIKRYVAVNLVVFMNNVISYLCAGGFGMLIHDGKIHTFKKNHNFLGLRKGSFSEYTLPVLHNDLLVLYTDGIVEAQDEFQNDYSVKRLNKLAYQHRNKRVSEILNICLQDYIAFRRYDQDDITLLILRF